MKNKIFYLLIVILLSVSTRVNAQTETDIDPNGRTFSQIFDSLSTGLIPARIPYGVLYDRVYPWSGLSQWANGDTTSVAHLFQSWFDAELSVIDPMVRPNNYDAMRTEVQHQLFDVKLPIVAFNFQFGYIDSMAGQDGRLSETNGILTDNGQASPYLTKQVAIAGIAIDKLVANKNYALQFGSPLVLNNTSTTIQNIVVANITSGAQYTLTAGAGQVIQFTQAGNNVLRFTVNLSNGSSYITYQVIQVQDINASAGGSGLRLQTPTGPNCTPTNDLIQSDIPFQGYNETQATNSFADYHIYYHTISRTATDCERILRKPIIVLDGFDPKNERPYYDLYEQYLKNNDNGANLGNDLRDKGYDVIILNFPVLGSKIDGQGGVPIRQIPSDVKVNGTQQTINAFGRDGGADYIERNAFLLVKLIQDVNIALAANSITEKIVIIGPSMGGQISRYALAYMEKKQAEGVPGMDHNTRLWVSFDSPHDGANIPLSLQQTLQWYGTTGQSTASYDAYESRLRPPAARQLLIEQVGGTNATSAFHQTYYNNLRSNGLPNSNGYPQNLRKIALVNGAGSGAQTYWDGAEILHGLGRATFLNIKVFELIANFLPSTGVNVRYLKARAAIKSILVSTNSLKLITQSFHITNNNPRGSMDAVPGGTYNTAEIVYNQFEEFLRKEKVRQAWSIKRFEHCFIPTISALGFKNPNFNWNTRVDDRDLVGCNNEINFDNYYIPPTNQPHVYLNTANVNWLIQELDNPVTSCIKVCSPISVSGDNSFCATSNNYTVDNLPAGAIVHWSVTPSGIATPTTPDLPQTTVSKNSDGFFTLLATVTNACSQASANKYIRAGNYSNSGIYIYGPTTVTYGETARYFTSEYQGVGYAWTYPDSWNYLTGQNTSSIGFQIPYSAQSGYVGVTSYDVCGANTQSIYVQVNSGGYYYSISPNPASSTFTVATKTTTDKGANINKSITEVNLYDQLGNLKKHQKFNKAKIATLNVSGLRKGVYFVDIIDGISKERQQLLIQ